MFILATPLKKVAKYFEWEYALYEFTPEYKLAFILSGGKMPIHVKPSERRLIDLEDHSVAWGNKDNNWYGVRYDMLTEDEAFLYFL